MEEEVRESQFTRNESEVKIANHKSHSNRNSAGRDRLSSSAVSASSLVAGANVKDIFKSKSEITGTKDAMRDKHIKLMQLAQQYAKGV